MLMRHPNPFKRKTYKYSHRLDDWTVVSSYHQREIVIESAGVAVVKYQVVAPSGVAGKRLVFFSDTHYLIPAVAEHNQAIADLIAETRPDILVYGGDIVSYNCEFAGFKDLLERLPTGPVRLAIPGNWDRYKKAWFPAERHHELFTEYDFDYLVNRERTVAGIRFYGIDDIKAGFPNFKLTEKSDFTVLLAHNPDLVIEIGRRQNLRLIDLCMCGHTHGGQIRLPLVGPVVASSRYGVRFAYGRYKHRRVGTEMIVSSGLGCSILPVRWNCQPEVVLVEFVEKS
jgi:uncharacterized protein